jgi:hypothetical protein
VALMFLGSFLLKKNAPGKGGSAAHQHRKGRETWSAVRNLLNFMPSTPIT